MGGFYGIKNLFLNKSVKKKKQKKLNTLLSFPDFSSSKILNLSELRTGVQTRNLEAWWSQIQVDASLSLSCLLP